MTGIRPLAGGGYHVDRSTQSGRGCPPLTCRKVIVAAGVLGTLELLFRCRDVLKTLPNISRQLGRIVRTNSEAIVGVVAPKGTEDLSQGVTISTDSTRMRTRTLRRIVSRPATPS